MTQAGESEHPLDLWLRRMLFLHAGLIPISIAAGQVWAYLAALLFLATVLTRPRPASGYPLGRVVALYCAAVLLSALVGVRPMHALAKADRLLLFAIPLGLCAWTVLRSPEAARPFLGRLLALLLAGCSLKALYDCFRIPIQYLWLRREAVDPASAPGLFDLGNMRDPQFYAVALCVLLALWFWRAEGYPRRLVLAALLVNALALLLHFKRGAWFSAAFGVCVVSLLSGRRAALLWILLVILAASQVPAVRDRILLLREEFGVGTGGRYALWMKVAPRVFEDYPWGMGWRSVDNVDLQQYPSVVVQAKLNHLHNNLLQIRLETGWPGVATWLMLMGTVLFHAARGVRRAFRQASPWRGPAVGLLAALLALHLNGLVEYNAGDGEIFMLMNLLMGLAVAFGLAHGRPTPHGAPTPATLRGC